MKYRIVVKDPYDHKTHERVVDRSELYREMQWLENSGLVLLGVERYRMDWNRASPEEIVARYPRLVAHLICESLGYFTPRAAAHALLQFKRGRPFFCEWYTHMAGGFQNDRVLEVGRQVLERAIRGRHRHHGYMADYGQARRVVAAELAGHGPVFASWF